MDLYDEGVEGSYPQFARMVRRALRQHQLGGTTLGGATVPPRSVCRKLKMSRETLAQMADGHRPSRSLVIEFAQGMSLPVNDLLKAANYPVLESDL